MFGKLYKQICCASLYSVARYSSTSIVLLESLHDFHTSLDKCIPHKLFCEFEKFLGLSPFILMAALHMEKSSGRSSSTISPSIRMDQEINRFSAIILLTPTYYLPHTCTGPSPLAAGISPFRAFSTSVSTSHEKSPSYAECGRILQVT